MQFSNTLRGRRASHAARRLTIPALLALSLSALCSGATIIARASPGNAASGSNPTTTIWSQADTWDNVAISLGVNNFYGFDPVGTTHALSVYLTNAIGPGTTAAANEIASGTFSFTTAGIQTLSAFSGLTLGPGTYYLTVTHTGFSSDAVRWGVNTVTPDAITGSGVTEGSEFDFTAGPAAYAPATDGNFSSGNRDVVYSVSGDLQAQQAPPPDAPEPATLLLAGAALSLMALQRRRASVWSRYNRVQWTRESSQSSSGIGAEGTGRRSTR